MARKYRSEEEMFKMCERFKASGLSIGAFCNEESINKHTFQYWRLKLIKKEAAPKSKKPASFHPIAPPEFAHSSDTITIHLADKLSIELPSSYSITQIANLVKSISTC